MQQAWAVQTYAAYDIVPLLRIPEASASLAAQAMDGGAHGIETDLQVLRDHSGDSYDHEMAGR